MRRLLVCALLLAGCRPNDGRSQSAPPTDSSAASPPAGSASGVDSARANALLAAADAGRIQGDSAAPIWMVEISDFQCPFCRRFHEESYDAIVRDYVRPGIVRMAYVNLPLQMHQHALPAADYAMCASAQNRFWQVHDALFQTQETWAPMQNPAPFFDSLVVANGVDATRLAECLASGTMRRLIAADVGRAANAGINSTPYFFVGSERIAGAAPLPEFRAAIERARAAAKGSPRPGG